MWEDLTQYLEKKGFEKVDYRKYVYHLKVEEFDVKIIIKQERGWVYRKVMFTSPDGIEYVESLPQVSDRYYYDERYWRTYINEIENFLSNPKQVLPEVRDYMDRKREEIEIEKLIESLSSKTGVKWSYFTSLSFIRKDFNNIFMELRIFVPSNEEVKIIKFVEENDNIHQLIKKLNTILKEIDDELNKYQLMKQL